MQMPPIVVTDDFQVPIPTLEEQNRIVSILISLALTTSLTEGLQLEIELRQKQYEYYRNMLLLQKGLIRRILVDIQSFIS